MINRNLIILSIGQVFSFTSPVVSVLLSGIIGASMTNINYLATLPTALMIVGTAIGSLIASKYPHVHVLGELTSRCVISNTCLSFSPKRTDFDEELKLLSRAHWHLPANI